MNEMYSQNLTRHPVAHRRVVVVCDRCGEEYDTRLWCKGDIHSDCGGEFKPLEYKGSMHND